MPRYVANLGLRKPDEDFQLKGFWFGDEFITPDHPFYREIVDYFVRGTDSNEPSVTTVEIRDNGQGVVTQIIHNEDGTEIIVPVDGWGHPIAPEPSEKRPF